MMTLRPDRDLPVEVKIEVRSVAEVVQDVQHMTGQFSWDKEREILASLLREQDQLEGQIRAILSNIVVDMLKQFSCEVVDVGGRFSELVFDEFGLDVVHTAAAEQSAPAIKFSEAEVRYQMVAPEEAGTTQHRDESRVAAEPVSASRPGTGTKTVQRKTRGRATLAMAETAQRLAQQEDQR